MNVTMAVIPVAGRGTRFLPVTKEVSKEMIPLWGRPGIHYVVEEAVAAGARTVVLVTPPERKMALRYFQRDVALEDFLHQRGQQQWAHRLREISQMANIISVDQESPLGLGPAILCAEKVVGLRPFAVLLPDELFFTAPEEPAPMAQLSLAFGQHQKSIVGAKTVGPALSCRYGMIQGPVDGPMEGILEKPPPEDSPGPWSAAGRYIFTPEIFEALKAITPAPGGEYQLTDAINILCQNQGAYAQGLLGKRFDTGTPQGHFRAMVYMALAQRPEVPQMQEMQGMQEMKDTLRKLCDSLENPL